ncbi:MAG: ATP-binding protein, partial [Bacillota bacterium]|nr:ATP-binding protein [Bacillota bacterium]
MKPKILKVKGLNSFVDEQIINFDELTSKGLFGIFGPTGSGKSTILDAITMALYGKMSRGMDNYVNSSSDLLVVSFDFEISYNGERKNYIAERSVKRDKNNNTRLSAARLYEKISEDSINVIADGSREVKDAVEKVIGLGFDDFSRSVVLPQGKFSEFLKIPPAERNNMLERLFGLEKYGRNLVDKINSKKKESISELDVLLGQVKSYEDKGITRENYIKEKQELSTLQKEEKKFKEEKENTDKLYEKYKVVWELQEELNVHSNRKIKLEERKKEFEDKKERIIAANKAAVIKPVIDDISKTDKSIKENEEELNKITIHLDKVKNEAEINKKQYETAFLRKETEIPKLIKKETNLNQAVTILIKIDGFEKEREELLEKYKTFNKDKKSLNSEILKLSSDKASIIKGINDIGDRLNIIKVDPEFRENVQNVLSLEKEYNNLLIDKKNREDKIKEKDLNKKKLTKDYEAVCVFRENNRIEILKIEEEMSKSQEKFPGDNNVLLMKQNETSLIKDKYLQSSKDIEKYTELKVRLNEVNKSKSILEKNTDEINKELENKNKIITDLKNQYDEIQIMNRASLIAIDIKEGTPCPVCGSIHHPKIASKIDEHILNENISKQEKLKKEIDTLDKESRKNEIELAKISNEIEHIEIDMKDLQPKIEGVVLTDLEKEKNKKEEEFENLKVSIKNYENLKNELENKLKSIKEEKNKIDRNEAKLGENINSENKHIEELTGEFEKVISEFEKISEKYLQAKKELNIMSAKDTMDNILKNEKETAKLIKEEKKLREDNEIIDKKLDEKNSALNQLEVQIAKIVESGQEKKRVIDGEKLEVSKLSEGEEPKSYIEIVRNQIKEINQNEEKLRIKLEKEN